MLDNLVDTVETIRNQFQFAMRVTLKLGIFVNKVVTLNNIMN